MRVLLIILIISSILLVGCDEADFNKSDLESKDYGGNGAGFMTTLVIYDPADKNTSSQNSSEIKSP